MNSPCSPEETPSRVARSVTRYQSCVVDPRPGRAVHCPDLNACLVNEGRPVPVDCRAVHFGYAIPVTVVPLPDEPDLAELVLDPSPDLTPQAVSYLLHHHPHFRQERVNGDMAATAKHEHMRGGGKFTGEPEEDIAAIAKQISDHAEAIYQTWKSRGLAPTEILTCHSNATAADKFGTALMPQSSSPQPKLFPVKASQPPPVVDLSLDANNLEMLVNNFVSEDKARLAAARQHKPVPSSIQYARQKFEKQLPEPQSSSPPSSSFVKPHHLDQLHTKTQPSHHAKTLQPPSKIPTSVTSNLGQYPHPVRNTSAQSHVNTAPLSRHAQPETIETTYPMDVTAVHKVQQLKKTVDVTENNPSSGLTTWPLKNKNLGVGIDKRVSSSKTSASNKDEVTKRRSIGEEPSGKQFSSLSTNNKNTAEYLDEVAREEERLINALKTGIIIAEERVGDPGAVSPSKKSNILLKKSSKDKVTGGVKKEKSGDKLPSSVQPETTPTVSTRGVPGRTSASPKTQTLAVSQQKSSIKEVDKSSLSTLSTVDYAKIRYHAAQQNPRTQQRLETAKHLEQPKTAAATVPVARTRFEAVEEGGWRPAVGGRARHPALESVPHPELTTQQRQHIRANSVSGVGVNPVRPFLTRGSVAERVLIFEKCPTELLLDKRRGAPAMSTWRTGHEVHTRAQTYSRDKENQRPAGHLPPNTTLQRHVRSNRNVHIPRFFYPQGKPTSEHQMEVALKKISAVFHQFPNQQVVKDKFHLVTKACDCPLYWKMPLFVATGGEKLGHVDSNTFLDFWKKLLLSCHDQASRFIHILTRGLRDHLTPDDLGAMVQDVVDSHPGLTFLKEATEFHSRYVHTVIARIFYCVNRSWSGRISLPELRRSNLLRVIQLLEEEEDINQVTSYFSYEHFYVIYCRFWELDRDHDLFIDRQDLHRHSEHALSTRIIERIFSGAVTRGSRQQSDKMSYTEFVWFLLSEEDKTHPTAIEYWFRCMDLDGDGYLSMYELEYFYEEQLQRMEAIGIETLPFEDCLCQMLDMIHPATPGKISLSDLKQCKMTSIFFDTFFNLEKYLDHEQRDPFASQREHDTDGQELSDWDRYAAEEYELLVAEEGSNDQQEDMLYEDDDTEGEDALSPNLDNIITNNNDSESKSEHWKKPSFTVTDFDMDDEDDDDSADYAADSDDCSL